MTEQSPGGTEQAPANEPGQSLTGAGHALQPVVGLGGSAGAIPALVEFLQQTRPCGLAYVVILHLAPEHESTLAELLQRHTDMPVQQVRDAVEVRADTVYVIPPRHVLQMVDGELQLGPLPEDRRGRVAVDLFFRTLADSHGPCAAAVVLSGLDSDGAIGIKRIKEHGGLTIAQDPAQAQHDGMPQAAIATGTVDWVLRAAQMPERLARYFERGQRAGGGAADQAITEDELRDVSSLLRERTGFDFSSYKRGTLGQRIRRRVRVNGLRDMGEYLACLRSQPGEAKALLQDLLASVSNFFRDRECFEALERQIPALFSDKGAGGVIRVWVPACATGEEAYSIAMLLAEHARTLEAPAGIQIFATDINEDAIRVAREGVYPSTIAADVSEERLRRFFTREQRGYRVRRELREMALFAVHDILKDSPFARLDLVSCRNLLIYLDGPARRRVLEAAHFALMPAGRLFLGASESVQEGDGGLFHVVDEQHGLHGVRPERSLSHEHAVARLRSAASKPPPAADGGFDMIGAPGVGASGTRPPSWSQLHLKMVELLAPPSLVVDGDHAVMHLSGSAGRYLRFTGGESSNDVFELIHPALCTPLRAAFYQALATEARAEAGPVAVDTHGRTEAVSLAVIPMSDVAPDMCLVIIDPRPEGADGARPSPAGSQADPQPLADLADREIGRLKSCLRDTVEEYEASTAELKASNEELQTINEELRSATEESETSREELRSVNEELTTVNQELESRVDELGHANSDLQNLMDATAIATVFLDRELGVTRYTPPAVALFNLIPTDIGRPLAHLTSQLDYPQLESDARRVLKELVPIEREVSDARKRWYLARMLPYRTSEARVAGIVLTLVDISERKHSQKALRMSEERFSAVANKAAVGLLQADISGVITFANRYLCEALGYREEDLAGRSMLDIVHRDDRARTERLLATLPDTGSFDVHTRMLRADGSVVWMHDSASHVLSGDDARGGLLAVCIDVTERKRAEEALRRSEEHLRLIIDNATEYAIFATDLARRVTSWSSGAERLLEWSESEMLGHSCDVIFIDEERARGVPEQEAAQALAKGRAMDERQHQRKSGERFWATGALMPMRGDDGETIGFVKILRDQSDVRRAREEVAASRGELVTALEDNQRARRQLAAADLAKDRFLATLAQELSHPLAAITDAASLLDGPDALDDAGQARARAVVADQAQAMRRLLDDLLDVSRQRLGRLSIETRATRLADVVDRALVTARPVLQRLRHELRVSLPDETLWLQADPERLGRALSHLLVNAASYTDDGGHVQLRARAEHGQCVIEVSDDGRGLDDATLGSLFDTFWRSGEAGAAGLGIGLALVRSVVTLHEGSVGAASDGPGKGSTFIVRLPLAAANAGPPAG